ncbi:MAG: LamG domain-containing protein [Bacteroidales bacterium]|nr:LamG domain-containing protein [Bacteroidales bacterium]MCF8391304.1 LamG domain-containing protein [Bacteroidales bacterium]
MKFIRIAFLFLVLFSFEALKGQSEKSEDLLFSWNFDSVLNAEKKQTQLFANYSREGYWKKVPGVRGDAVKLDGYTSKIVSAPVDLTKLLDGFSVEAWLALQAYPWNWAAIINQGVPKATNKDFPDSVLTDFFLGVDALGRLGFSVTLEDSLYYCVTEKKLSLLDWNHVAATFDPEEGISIYINAELSGRIALKGRPEFSSGSELWIGRSLKKAGAYGSERMASYSLHTDMVLEGLLDEIHFYNKSLSSDRIKESYLNEKPQVVRALKWNTLPSPPTSTHAKFGAIYTRLNYTEEWESLWKTDKYPDILVQFENSPVRLIFWRGTGYGAVWITENDIWMGDQSLERVGKNKSPMGCAEHMSDKQTRYSQVRILEQNDARIVIHWRYALTDIVYNVFNADDQGEWGEWADEYYYIYPDGITTRYQILHSDKLSHEWQETIVINQPGTYPENNIELEAMTLANLDGEIKTYSWANGAPDNFNEPENKIIQMVNLKSDYKPFIIFEPEVKIKPFRGAIRPEYSKFPWWNHWPVAQIPNDGRKAFAPDRPSHSSLSQSIEDSKVIHNNGNGSYSVVTLTGMTDKPIKDLLNLAKSWNNNADCESNSDNLEFIEYSKNEKVYILNYKSEIPEELDFKLLANKENPLVNPAFVLRNWQSKDISIELNGKKLEEGKEYRLGINLGLQESDLVLWLELISTEEISIIIKPVNR